MEWGSPILEYGSKCTECVSKIMKRGSQTTTGITNFFRFDKESLFMAVTWIVGKIKMCGITSLNTTGKTEVNVVVDFLLKDRI